MDRCKIGVQWFTPTSGISGITASSSHLYFLGFFLLFFQFYHFFSTQTNNIYHRMYYMIFEIHSHQPLNKWFSHFGCLDNTIITKSIWSFIIINIFITFLNFRSFFLLFIIIICNCLSFFSSKIICTSMWHIIFSR